MEETKGCSSRSKLPFLYRPAATMLILCWRMSLKVATVFMTHIRWAGQQGVVPTGRPIELLRNGKFYIFHKPAVQTN